MWRREPLNGNQETRAAVHSCAEWVLHSFRDTTYTERCFLELCSHQGFSATRDNRIVKRNGVVAHLEIPYQDYPGSLSLSPSA